MADDSERADRASDADAGTSDGGVSGDGESGSDPAADTSTDTGPSTDAEEPAAGTPADGESAAVDADAGDASPDDGPTEVDAADTVERLRGDDGPDDAERAPDQAATESDAPGDAGDDHDGDETRGHDASDEPSTDDPEADDTATDDASEPSGGDDESSPESGRESVGPRLDEGPDEDGAGNGTSDDAGDDFEGSDDIWPGDEGTPADTASMTGTDGGTPAAAGGAATGTGADDPLVDDGLVSEGPETDEEMPLADHIEEMIHRLAVVLGVGGIITLLLYPGADLANSAFGLDLVSSTEVIDFLWNKHVPGAPELTDRRPRVYGPLELLLTELKVAALGGLVVGLPVFVYETYLFMRPGLYPKERRYYLAAVPTSIVLAFVGISFAHFIVLPAIFAYFTSYTTGTAIVAFGLKETFNLILILMGYNAIIFQIPLFIMLAIMMNLVTRTWLEDRRLLFWGAFLGLAFLVSPDPTGMAPIIIGATMIALFEGTLLALRWTASGSFVLTAEKLAARRPQAVVVAGLVGYLLSSLPAPAGYHDLLPSAATAALAANGLAVYTPVVIAGSLVGAFEAVAFLLRRYGRSQRALRARLAVSTARRPAWLAAAVVGYLGSPDPVALRVAAAPNLRPTLAVGVAVGLLVGYEALRLLLASRADRGT
ncbi:twin-arginine translocase subunit TatC [Halobellus sp. MBLA0160]|uniref:Sec-independent protein translocase protein TatC n=1 Tax=Halobellus ruber TaxID=2761102 RepID=A0A7J9SLS8_9EURY|nr:twin-arginine translocase subunit TatC [Halobellus ruber]